MISIHKIMADLTLLFFETIENVFNFPQARKMFIYEIITVNN